jgi:hypothetical protein
MQSVYLSDLDNKRSQLKDENIKATEALFKKFFLSEPLKIAKSQELAIHMADRGKIVKEFILEILESKQDDRFSKKILGLYEVFKKTLVEDLEEGEFAWEFYIGGYQVLDKWLKSRKDRVLSYEEKETFTKIVNTLDFTIEQMEKIDEITKKVMN